MESGIYLILSPTHKPYIGESKNIRKRWMKYKNNLARGQVKLNRSFLKHGFENHNFIVLEYCKNDLLYERERYYQDLYSSMKLGLNCKLTPTKSKKVVYDENTLYKMGSANRGKNIPEETKRKISEGNKGKIVSKETREKLRKSNLGKKDGFKNGNHKKVKVLNKKGECLFISYMNVVAMKYNINNITLKKRCVYYNNGLERVLKDLEFYFVDNPNKKLNFNYRRIILDTFTGIYYYSYLELANELNKTESIIRTMVKNNNRYILTED